ncbi:MAG: LysM peptidoglycan-binding domain-containing protein [Peptococcaceae bacterium]|nr:LysM peptidoglycan-binding domain-containing protein [Peptococcaceae bacterium]MBQ2859806.1 LysM peptidoglycan-binding domain-containing protein [Peptococcaceae bacterium]
MNMTKKLKSLVAVTAVLICCSFMTGGACAEAAAYQVQSGDTLYKIAANHKITVEELKRANNLKNSTIRTGEVLQIPVYMQHRIKAGESLYLIARQYGCTVEAIKKVNGLSSNTIQPGKILKIPADAASAAVSTGTSAVVTTSRGGNYRSYSQQEWDMLAQVVYGEARGESYNGQVAVAAVVLNRMEHDDFPDTIYEVVFQENAFTCVQDGQYYLTPNRSAYQAALEAMHGADPTNGCLYYWNPVTATSSWIWTRSIELQIGNHVFGL